MAQKRTRSRTSTAKTAAAKPKPAAKAKPKPAAAAKPEPDRPATAAADAVVMQQRINELAAEPARRPLDGRTADDAADLAKWLGQCIDAVLRPAHVDHLGNELAAAQPYLADEAARADAERGAAGLPTWADIAKIDAQLNRDARLAALLALQDLHVAHLTQPDGSALLTAVEALDPRRYRLLPFQWGLRRYESAHEAALETPLAILNGLGLALPRDVWLSGGLPGPADSSGGLMPGPADSPNMRKYAVTIVAYLDALPAFDLKAFWAQVDTEHELLRPEPGPWITGSPKELGRRFGCCRRTLDRRADRGIVEIDKITSRRWRVREIPPPSTR